MTVLVYCASSGYMTDCAVDINICNGKDDSGREMDGGM